MDGESPELIAEKHARRRAQLPRAIRSSERVARMLSYGSSTSPSSCASRHPFRREGLLDASETILRVVQEELRTRTSPLDIAVAIEIAGARLWAIHALSLVTGSHSYAKRIELEMTDGAPLAVCVGTGPFWPAVAGFQKTWPVQWYKRELSLPALGCRAVMPESPRLGGVMWRYWCDECAPNKGTVRAQIRRHVRRLNRDYQSFYKIPTAADAPPRSRATCRSRNAS